VSTFPVTLNVVGCGKLGTTLPRLLKDSGGVRIGGLYSRTVAHAEVARTFIGQGSVVDSLAELPAAELWLVAVSDHAIADTGRQLAALHRDWHEVTVFHASGVHDAGQLSLLATLGARTASLHPAHSFADRDKSLLTFAGTCCALEGEPAAKAQLSALFSLLPVRLFEIETAAKPLYHAATAMASNYLVSLIATSLSLLAKAGIGEQDARALLAPLASQTAANVFARGPAAALTGPITRGDSATVARHLTHLTATAPETLDVYRSLGRATLELASTSGELTPDKVSELAALFAAAASKL